MNEKRNYRIEHITEYTYSSQAALSMNQVCLKARESSHQKVLNHHFATAPKADFYQDSRDFFGNNRRLFTFQKPHRSLQISSSHRVEIHSGKGLGNGDLSRPEPFLYQSPFVPIDKVFADYGRDHFPNWNSEGGPQTAGLLSLMGQIYSEFEYDDRVTDISTPVKKVLELRRGVCQDFAHLMLAVLRSLGIPARYVSGYLNTLPPRAKRKS
jgi:transglutaminase-like putative cysteine protease